jgi:hypothetical protein
VVGLSALRTGRVYPPRKYSWYSFLLEAEVWVSSLLKYWHNYVINTILMEWLRKTTNSRSLFSRCPCRDSNTAPPEYKSLPFTFEPTYWVNAWNYPYTPQYVAMAWCLVRHWDDVTFHFPLLSFYRRHARFMVLTAVLLKIHIFWGMTPCHWARRLPAPEDDVTAILRNVDNPSPNNISSHSGRLESLHHLVA